MKTGMTRAASWVVALMFVGCGSSQKEPAQSGGAAVDSADASSASASNGANGSAPGTGGTSDSQMGGLGLTGVAPDAGAVEEPPAHPFAKTAAEATGLIDDAISSRSKWLTKCVEDLRTRKKDPHAKVTVEIGIDQEGSLLGVKTPKGQTEDKTLNQCVQTALRGAPFPKSHAGVITVKKSFEDAVVYK